VPALRGHVSLNSALFCQQVYVPLSITVNQTTLSASMQSCDHEISGQSDLPDNKSVICATFWVFAVPGRVCESSRRPIPDPLRTVAKRCDWIAATTKLYSILCIYLIERTNAAADSIVIKFERKSRRHCYKPLLCCWSTSEQPLRSWIIRLSHKRGGEQIKYSVRPAESIHASDGPCYTRCPG
jgi:hypothetical protein